MIVPQFWAEGRVRKRQDGRQLTLRRFGWSDISQADAQRNADARAQEAFDRAWAGEKLPVRDPKIPYNGADGVPIREEIVDRRGETIITRNSYGARCLNTPDVFFADIDFEGPPTGLRADLWIALGLLVIAIAVRERMDSIQWGGILLASAFFLRRPVVHFIKDLILKSRGGVEKLATHRISQFLEKNPTWNLRIYRTPAGLRVLATHQKFSPSAPEVLDGFKAIGTDPVYRRMCLNQQCFRARVSPKPWRIGLGKRIRPSPGVWPVNPEKQSLRNAWIFNYENLSQAFSACRFIQSLGSGIVHPEIAGLVDWHDELCRANENLPMA